MRAVDAAAVSHWHGDHTCGFPTAMHMIFNNRPKDKEKLVVDVHPDRPYRRCGGFAEADGSVDENKIVVYVVRIQLQFTTFVLYFTIFILGDLQ